MSHDTNLGQRPTDLRETVAVTSVIATLMLETALEHDEKNLGEPRSYKPNKKWRGPELPTQG